MADSLEDEIEDIVRKNIPPVVFPEVQKVEIQNLPAPIVKVSPPKVVVEAPIVKVDVPIDTKKIEKLLSDILTKETETDFSEMTDELKRLAGELKTSNSSGYRGGGIGPSKLFFKDKKGQVVNPAQSIQDEEILSETQGQGTIIAGKRDISLGKQIAEYIGVTGKKTDALKVLDENNYILKEILVELKAIKLHQEYLTELTFDGTE